MVADSYFENYQKLHLELLDLLQYSRYIHPLPKIGFRIVAVDERNKNFNLGTGTGAP